MNIVPTSIKHSSFSFVIYTKPLWIRFEKSSTTWTRYHRLPWTLPLKWCLTENGYHQLFLLGIGATVHFTLHKFLLPSISNWQKTAILSGPFSFRIRIQISKIKPSQSQPINRRSNEPSYLSCPPTLEHLTPTENS